MVNFCLQCGREINTNAVLCDKCSTIYMMFSVPNLDKTYSHNKEEVLQIKEESGDKEQIISNTGVYQFGLKSLRPPILEITKISMQEISYFQMQIWIKQLVFIQAELLQQRRIQHLVL